MVLQLRRLLEPDPAEPVHLLTVRGHGYRLALDPPRTNLGPSAGPLFGRDALLDEVVGHVEAHRWVVLVGPPGAGKTRVAEAAAHRVAQEWPGGAWWVDARSATRGAELLTMVRAALGLAEGAADPSAAARLVGASLGRRPRMLVVLDNLEQVRDAEDVLGLLLRHAPAARLLGTSSRRLDLGTGQVVVVPRLDRADAVALFRASAAAAGVPPAGDETSIGALCAALDDWPLGVSLAARRAGAIDPRALTSDATARVQWLELGEQRSQSVRRAVEWAIGLASAAERRVLVALTVFRDAFDLAAASAVTGATPADVAQLVDRSLLDGGPVSGYRLFGPVLDVVRDRPPPPDVVQAHRTWFLGRARAMWAMRRGSDRAAARVESTRTARDLAAAVDASIPGDLVGVADVLQLVIHSSWLDRSDAVARLEQVLAIDPSGVGGRLWALWAVEHLRAYQFGDAAACIARATANGLPADASDLLVVKATLAELSGEGFDPGPLDPRADPALRAAWTSARSLSAHRAGQADAAAAILREGVRLARRDGDLVGARDLQFQLALAEELLGLPSEAVARQLERLMTSFEAEGLYRGAGSCAYHAAHRLLGEPRRARALAQRAVDLGRACGPAGEFLVARGTMALVYAGLADDDPADLLAETLTLASTAEANRDLHLRWDTALAAVVTYLRLDLPDRAREVAQRLDDGAPRELRVVLRALTELQSSDPELGDVRLAIVRGTRVDHPLAGWLTPPVVRVGGAWLARRSGER
ncbi:MAG: AAA family ATPase [Myxococcota bacterium]